MKPGKQSVHWRQRQGSGNWKKWEEIKVEGEGPSPTSASLPGGKKWLGQWDPAAERGVCPGPGPAQRVLGLRVKIWEGGRTARPWKFTSVLLRPFSQQAGRAGLRAESAEVTRSRRMERDGFVLTRLWPWTQPCLVSAPVPVCFLSQLEPFICQLSMKTFWLRWSICLPKLFFASIIVRKYAFIFCVAGAFLLSSLPGSLPCLPMTPARQPTGPSWAPCSAPLALWHSCLLSLCQSFGKPPSSKTGTTVFVTQCSQWRNRDTKSSETAAPGKYRCYYYPHFCMGNRGPGRLSFLPHITQLFRDGARTHT